jgi:hypothetical protein
MDFGRSVERLNQRIDTKFLIATILWINAWPFVFLRDFFSFSLTSGNSVKDNWKLCVFSLA